MNKSEFLKKLKSSLTRMTKEERERTLSYYSELIDDRIDSGATEEEAVGALGNIDEITAQILRDAEEQGTLKPERKPVNTTLLIVGSPLWVPLLIAALSVIFSLYVTVWAVLFSFWASVFAFAVSALGGVVGGSVYLVFNLPVALTLLGSGLVLAGLALALVTPMIHLTRLVIKLSVTMWLKIIKAIKAIFGGAE